MKITELINLISKYDSDLKVVHSTHIFFRFVIVDVPKRDLDKKRMGLYKENYDGGNVIAIKSLSTQDLYYRQYTVGRLISVLKYYDEAYNIKELVLCTNDTYCSPNIFSYINHNGELNLI